MIIITSGRGNVDIDAYGGAIDYAYLLNLQGIKAKAVCTGNLNESITPSMLKLEYKLDNYTKSEDDKFIVVDVSYKDFFDKIVNEKGNRKNELNGGKIVVYNFKKIYL